jgi:hypothetical protein
MRSRSEIHMLTVAAARLEQAAANPKLVSDLREAAGISVKKKARREDGRDHDAAERQQQTDRHRHLFELLPNGSDKARLADAMLQYAYDLMWDGDCAGVDALCEFLPGNDVAAMLDAWSSDQFGDQPKSKWYEG